MKDVIEDAMNEQLNNELYAHYLYLAMAAHFEEEDWPGFAAWMRAQSQEEYDHAMRFYDFIHSRNGSVELEAIEKPQPTFDSPLDAFEQAYEHEQKVSESIHDLYALSEEEDDYASHPFLEHFIEEQIEEEDTTNHIVERLRKAGDDRGALLMIDDRLGERGGGAGDA